MKNNNWLYLDSYVHAYTFQDSYLVYNSLNGTYIDGQQPDIFKLVERLNDDKNLYVVDLQEQDLNNRAIAEFVQQLRGNFMGDMLNGKWFAGRPFQMAPRLKVLQDIEKSRHLPTDADSEFGYELMKNLSELTIYINKGKGNGQPLFENGYLQAFLPHNNGDGGQELSFDHIRQLVLEAQGSSVYRLNILGGNILEHSELKNIAELFNSFPFIKCYYVPYHDLPGREKELKYLFGDWEAGAVHDIAKELNLLIYFPVDMGILERVMGFVQAAGLNVRYQFVIDNAAQMGQVEEITAAFNLQNVGFMPYYTGKNLDFFEAMVYLDKESIMESRPSQQDIFARRTLNQLHFGRLTIRSNGNIHANVNHPPVGNVAAHSLHQVIANEIKEGPSWFSKRADFSPCSQCVFQEVCPSPSNYEYVIGKSNLCHINKGI